MLEMLSRRANRITERHVSTLAHREQPNHPPTKKLLLLPRSKLTEATLVSGDPLEEEAMLQADDEDSRKLFSIRNLDEVEVYFTNLTPEYRFRLVDKLVRFAIGQGPYPYS
jgi:translation initiation factor 4G